MIAKFKSRLYLDRKSIEHTKLLGHHLIATRCPYGVVMASAGPKNLIRDHMHMISPSVGIILLSQDEYRSSIFDKLKEISRKYKNTNDNQIPTVKLLMDLVKVTEKEDSFCSEQTPGIDTRDPCFLIASFDEDTTKFHLFTCYPHIPFVYQTFEALEIDPSPIQLDIKLDACICRCISSLKENSERLTPDLEIVVLDKNGFSWLSPEMIQETYNNYTKNVSERKSEALKRVENFKVDFMSLDLNLNDANYVLFQCPQENDTQAYATELADLSSFCGLYSLINNFDVDSKECWQALRMAQEIQTTDALAKYITQRLMDRPSTRPLALQLDIIFGDIYLLPESRLCVEFEKTMNKIFEASRVFIESLMSPFVQNGSSLVKKLALSSVALVSQCDKAPLPQVKTKLTYQPSIAAGLPSFACNKRNQGEETFIALRGLLLVTGRFEEAKSIILAYARAVNNGLIPSVLGDIDSTQYCSRAAVWWWLYSIREYTKMVPNGYDILNEELRLIYEESSVKSLERIIQEVISIHFEDNREIDKEVLDLQSGQQMTSPYKVNKMNGFLHEPTEKESHKDGSRVEVVGLCKVIIDWLHEMNQNILFKFEGVESSAKGTASIRWTWKQWSDLIESNFHRFYPLGGDDGQSGEENTKTDSMSRATNSDFKESVDEVIRLESLWKNSFVVMAIAPHLFETSEARAHLDWMTSRGPFEQKSSKFGWDSADLFEGEVWLLGYYMRVASRFKVGDKPEDFTEVFEKIKKHLRGLWCGLPNTMISDWYCDNKIYNSASSVGSILEAIHELDTCGQKNSKNLQSNDKKVEHIHGTNR